MRHMVLYIVTCTTLWKRWLLARKQFHQHPVPIERVRGNTEEEVEIVNIRLDEASSPLIAETQV